MNDDLISRKEAIEALSFDKELLNRVLDDMDVVGIDREKYTWGLGLVESYIADIEDLPPAQPEIIRCKDCKYGSPNSKYGCKCYHYALYETHEMKSDDFCSRAERRSNGGLD